MLISLSPNGDTQTVGQEAATELLVGTIRGIVHFTRDAQGAWVESHRSLEDVHVSSIAIDNETGLVLVGGHGQGGLWASRDWGKTFAASDTGILERHIFSVVIQKRPEGMVCYAGVEPAGLYVSHDAGGHWDEIPALRKVPGTELWTFPPPPHIAHCKNITWHPSDPDKLLVCVEQGALLRTFDGGATFDELTDYSKSTDRWYRDCHRTLIHPTDPQMVLLVGGEGVYRSTDGGEHFLHVQTITDRLGYPDATVINPWNENMVICAGAGDPPRSWMEQAVGTARPGVIMSEDFGLTWRESMDGIPQDEKGNFEAMCLYGHDGSNEMFLGGATGDIWYSPDTAKSWTKIATGLPPVSKVHHYRWFLSAEERKRIENLAAKGL